MAPTGSRIAPKGPLRHRVAIPNCLRISRICLRRSMPKPCAGLSLGMFNGLTSRGIRRWFGQYMAELRAMAHRAQKQGGGA